MKLEPTYLLIRWGRRPGEFARRISVDGIKGALSGGVVVEEGSQGLLMINGALERKLEPGWTPTEKDRLMISAGEPEVHFVEVLMIQDGRTKVTVPQVKALTKDQHEVQVEIHTYLSLNDPMKFMQNVMKVSAAPTRVQNSNMGSDFDAGVETFGHEGRANGYLISDLAQYLRPEVKGALRRVASQFPVESLLNSEKEWIHAFLEELREALGEPLQGAGLVLEKIGIPEARCILLEQTKRELDKIRKEASIEIERGLSEAEQKELKRQEDMAEFNQNQMKRKSEMDGEIDLSRQMMELDIQRRKEASKAQVAGILDILETKARIKRLHLQAFVDWDPELALIVLASSDKHMARALREKFRSDGAKDREELIDAMYRKMMEASESQRKELLSVIRNRLEN